MVNARPYSPLPWTLKRDDAGNVRWLDANDRLVTTSLGESGADADYQRRAGNAYPSLVEALRLAIGLLDGPAFKSRVECSTVATGIMDAVRAVLRDAGEA
jgi:hypothetical protein